ncbi:MAG TPA: 2-aminoethylphosphonate--pyruvate transaminase [Patescibacteria group bacterium]|nr:2-aminoethylphosphonate--pyruvate transaminase [Patescibacteria group bacterium]
MNQYKLLTPGPLTTSRKVKEAMLLDRCTWDDEYKQITQKIRRQLLALIAASPAEYTAVLLQGSGSFGVEAVLMTAISGSDKCLFVTNGAYGERMVSMAERIGINHLEYRTAYDQAPVMEEICRLLEQDQRITHIAMVHCETTTGIVNPLEDVAKLAKKYGKSLIIDAMSSFGGMEIPVPELDIDFLISSANKCIQGVPGFCFVLAKRKALLRCQGNSHSLSLDVYDQWQHMEPEGKWRFTSPTHTVAAFSQALDELEAEGGVAARFQRYQGNNNLLRELLKPLGFVPYINEGLQSPIITTFLFPREDFDFKHFYQYVKTNGFVLYPGKLTDVDTFRVGNIGEIYEKDIRTLCAIIAGYMKGQKQ